MTKKIFIDSDIILDMLCKREPFYKDSAEIFNLSEKKKIELLTSPVVFANIFYILRKLLGTSKAKNAIKCLRDLVGVLCINEKITDLALNSNFFDFEDALQYFASKENNIEILLTRNIKDYIENDITVLTPKQFLNRYE